MAPTDRRRPRFDPRLFAWGLNDQQPAPRRTVGVNNVHLFSRGLKCLGLLDVRFTPESGHMQCTSACLLWDKSGHGAIYSITSVARASSDAGTVRPSALAVL